MRKSSRILTFSLLISGLLATSAQAEGFTPRDLGKDKAAPSKQVVGSHLKTLRQRLPKIIGGTDAKPGEFPHQVSLAWASNGDGTPGLDRHFCGGSIVGDQWVLTAAHCVAYSVGYPNEFRVGSGSIDLNKLTEFEAQEIWVHPRYDAVTLDYDFALVKVKDPFFDREIKIVDKSDNQYIKVGDTATATGWGVDSSGNIQQILKKVDVEVVSRTDCNDDNSYNGQVTSRMICAGVKGGGKDACQGDSGGPLEATISSSGGRVLFGATSWGYGCAEPEYYGVYSRIVAVRDWVDTIMGN